MLVQFISNIILIVVEQELESFSNSLYEMWFKKIHFSEERVAKNEIGKHLESFDLTNYQGKNNNGIGHSLDVADIGSVEVEHFQDLGHL